MKQTKILIIEDEKLIRWSLEKHLGAKDFRVFTAESGEEGLKLFALHHPEIVITDNKLPGMQGLEVVSRLRAADPEVAVIFMTAFGSIDTAVNAMKAGASEYFNKPFSFEEVDVVIENVRQRITMAREVELLRRQQRAAITFDDIIGQSGVVRDIVQTAKKIARAQTTTILLLGESGTGKDLFARAIHNESSQGAKPFVTINCSSLPESLLESELFGHEKGAFTDARQQKKGLFEIADGGTVFLDEVGEINLATQVKLLGVIENRVIRRVGGTTDIPVEIRIIAATNKDMKSAVESRTFREDLYYRLKVFQIVLPSLREHKADIPLLADHFIRFYNARFKKKVGGMQKTTVGLLSAYDWPGNVRELRNVIERAVILESTTLLSPDNLPGEIMHPTGKPALPHAESSPSFTTMEPQPGTPGELRIDFPEEGISLYNIEKEIIVQALEKAGQNQTRASKLLKISRDTLRYKMKKYDL